MSALSDLSPSAEHAYVAGAFLDLARRAGPGHWDDPSPVPEWTAREVVAHLVDWLPGLLSSGAGIDLPAVPPVADDPAAAWIARTADVQALLDDPGDRMLSNPHIGELGLADAIDRFYTMDVFLHSWDLGRALGLDPGLDPERCERMLAGAEPHEEAMRSSGQYGPRMPVSPDAPAQDRLAAFIGRDPDWRAR